MEHFPRCVRQAWDSAEEPQEPEVRQLLRSVNPKEWQLPCYPRLGELSPDEEDFSRGRTFGPCRLLRYIAPNTDPENRAPACDTASLGLQTPHPLPARSPGALRTGGRRAPRKFP